MAYAELYIAWGWTCSDCGKHQFVEGAPIPEEEKREVIDAMGMDETEVGGEFVSQPLAVTCRECKAKFDVKANLKG